MVRAIWAAKSACPAPTTKPRTHTAGSATNRSTARTCTRFCRAGLRNVSIRPPCRCCVQIGQSSDPLINPDHVFTSKTRIPSETRTSRSISIECAPSSRMTLRNTGHPSAFTSPATNASPSAPIAAARSGFSVSTLAALTSRARARSHKAAAIRTPTVTAPAIGIRSAEANAAIPPRLSGSRSDRRTPNCAKLRNARHPAITQPVARSHATSNDSGLPRRNASPAMSASASASRPDTTTTAARGRESANGPNTAVNSAVIIRARCAVALRTVTTADTVRVKALAC